MVLIMKKIFTLFLPIVLVLFVTGYVSAQSSILRYADKQFQLENYANALSAYQDAHAKKPTYLTARKVAETHRLLRNYEESYDWYGKVVAYKEATRDDYKDYLTVAMQAGNLEIMEGILSGSSFAKSDFPEIDFAGIDKLLSLKSNVKLSGVAEANSDGSDFNMAVSGNNRYFSSDRGAVKGGSRPSIRLDAKNYIFSADKSDINDRTFYGIYQLNDKKELTRVSTDVAGAYHITDPFVLNGGDLIFYTAVVAQTKLKKTKDFSNYEGIYFGKLDDSGKIVNSKPFPTNNHLSYRVMNPFVDQVAKRVYFVSDMPGGLGGLDIYYVAYDEQMNFGAPVNLGPQVNTSENETYPFVSGNQFYFSTKGRLGLGGMDIFVADMQGDSFGNPRNLGSPFNSERDDFAFYVADNGKRYLSSDRKGGLGLDDIYIVEDLAKRLVARVVDCDGNVIHDGVSTDFSKKQEPSKALKLDKNSQNQLTSDLDLETDYRLGITKKGYFPVIDDNLTTKGVKDEVIEREYKLAKIPYRTPVYIDIVYYDLDKAFIRKDAEPILEKIGSLMQKYPFLDLLVASHTDSRASDAYNMALSQRRADAVKDYLKKFSVVAERIRMEWFGEQKLVNNCGDGVPCPEPVHQLNRRSELVLEAFSDVNKDYEMPEMFKGQDPCDIERILADLSDEISNLPTIYFDFDKYSIRPLHLMDLERVAAYLRRMDSKVLMVSGHTDERGTGGYNMDLSKKRAQAIVDYLKGRGVNDNQMEIQFFGKNMPAVDCESLDCPEVKFQQNRRVELSPKK